MKTYLSFAFVDIIALFFAIIALTSWKIVSPGNRGISVTLATVKPYALAEGVHFKMPLIETINEVSVQQKTLSGTTTCFSSDIQTIHIKYSVMYRIPEGKVVELFLKYQGDPYTSLVEPRINDSLKQVVAKLTAEEIIKKRELIRTEVVEKLHASLKELVIVDDFPITNIDLTDLLEKAIEQKQVMEQQAKAKEYELLKARKEAEITQVNAEAEAKAVKIKGDALRTSPEVISLEIAKRWDGKTPQSVVVGQGGANILLPLK